MHSVFEAVRGWRLSLRRVQATRLILLPCLTGVLTGAATIGLVVVGRQRDIDAFVHAAT